MRPVSKFVRMFIIGVLFLLPQAAYAQVGSIAGQVRDASGGALPGVTVEVSSPALIEKVRATATDGNGRYQISALPVGTYTVKFSLQGFGTATRENVQVTSDFTANVAADLKVGDIKQEVTVSGEAPLVDVQTPRQAVTFSGGDLRDLPTTRNINSLLSVTPGLATPYNTVGSLQGVCVGGIGVFCNPGLPGFTQGDTGALQGGFDGPGTNNLNQGRVLVDGQVINASSNQLIGGMTGGYTADIVNVQEISIQLNGALGESETGGATINIVPRTGGNRFSGEFNTTYLGERFFDRNTGNFPAGQVPALLQLVRSDYDVSGGVGGPILRDRLWFYSVARQQRTHKLPVGTDIWPNLWEGQWGYNYQPDRSKPRLEYKNYWRNANARLTLQASQRNKFNIFWDEQDFCQDPCTGLVAVTASVEGWSSNQIRPNRLQQIRWTNPFTSRLLFEAGLNVSAGHYNTTEHREYRNPREIPRLNEAGTSIGTDEAPAMAAGGDSVARRVNAFAGGGAGFASGSVSGGFFEMRKTDNYRSTASASYITGSHNAKVGWDGAYYLQDQFGEVNDPRLTYNYSQPSTNCANNNTCGSVLAAQFPDEALLGNPFRRPRPSSVSFSTGHRELKDRVWYGALYVQDQWTVSRFTLTGALRYDHAESRYGSTCVGEGEPFARVQADGTSVYCTPETDGVNYNDVSPRFGAVWDIFGNGKTAIKWNMGKYLQSAGISGLYTGANPARNTVNSLTRNWTDTDADRIVDCDLLNTASNGECGAFTSSAGDLARYGLDPFTSPLGLATVQCGRQGGDVIIQQAAQDYCAAYGDSLIDGWGKRGYEWQIGLGVQREILPRLSGEVTYNRRLYRNITSSDVIGIGCDRFNGAQDTRTCQEAYLNYQGDAYTDFFEYVAPLDPRLDGGGGYRVLGLTNARATTPAGVTVQTLDPERNYAWQGVDTNFVWRAPFGLRINGGTSTSRATRETCYAMYDGPGSNAQGREGHEYEAGCRRHVPFQTRINGTASYTIPWVDVLVSTVFQSIPGAEISASVQNVLATDPNITWLRPERLNEPCTGVDAGTDPNNPNRGCFSEGFGIRNSLDGDIDILIQNEFWGERTTLFDLKFAKNLRFSGRRVQVGVDIYNVFNSDAIQSYEGDYDPTNQEWLEPRSVVQPRVARFSLQFSF